MFRWFIEAITRLGFQLFHRTSFCEYYRCGNEFIKLNYDSGAITRFER